MEQPSLIGINSSVVCKIEIVLRKKISSKHIKMSSGFFLIKVKKEGDAMQVSIRLKEKEQKQNF